MQPASEEPVGGTTMQKKQDTINKYDEAGAPALVIREPSLTPSPGRPANPHQALFDSVPQSGFKCDIIFLVIKNRIQEEPEYVKKLRVVFQFNLTKEGHQEPVVWTCDTKTSIEGDVYRSAPRPGLKADCVLTLDDDDFVKIMVGKLNPQRAFMMSKFRVRGNIMLLQKLHALWFDLRRKGRAPEIDLVQELMDEPVLAGVKADAMAIELVQRVVKMPYLLDKINATIRIDVLQQGELVISYGCVLRPNTKPNFKRYIHRASHGQQQQPATSVHSLAPEAIFVLEDDDLVLLMYGVCRVDEAIARGTLKVLGNVNVAERAKSLFEQPPIMAKL